MKRWILRISLCLILGAITTVAVAWWISSREPWHDTGFDNLVAEEDSGRWQLHCLTADAFGTVWIWSFTDRAAPEFMSETPNWSIVPRLADSTAFTGFAEFNEYAYGWPSLCVFERRLSRGVVPAVLHVDPGWHPIWPGFVIDTLFYAAIWGVVWFGFVGGKRFIRSKRGRCPRCGYDLRGQRAEVSDQRSEVSGARAGCPECGWGREGRCD